MKYSYELSCKGIVIKFFKLSKVKDNTYEILTDEYDRIGFLILDDYKLEILDFRKMKYQTVIVFRLKEKNNIKTSREYI